MNSKNVKQIKGNHCEDIVTAYLTGKGWKVARFVHGKGMADIVLYHEDLGIQTLQVKTLRKQGGKHIASNGLVMEGERPRIVLPLKDGKRYYKDNHVDWMVGVDPVTQEMHFYPYSVYKNFGTQLLIDKVESVDFPDAPELEQFKKEKEIPTLDEFWD